ncbi:MAG: hypothetical protein LUF82_05210 [Clostridia bacterium]|nr:hypothetical protein [Clostridia bacterium]
MKDFKNYNDNGNFEDDKGVNFVKSVAQSMQGKSESEIMRAVIAQAEQGKRSGTLTNKDLDNFYAAVAPSLDGFKRKKLKEIIARLKNI